VYTFLVILHIIVSILLMLVILIQSSKGGALSGTFGGAAGSFLGNRAATTFLSKVTTGLAAAFMLISVIISLMSVPRGEATSIIRREAADRRVTPSADLPAPQGSMTEDQLPVTPQ